MASIVRKSVALGSRLLRPVAVSGNHRNFSTDASCSSSSSSCTSKFPGASSEFTTQINFLKHHTAIPCVRRMDEQSKLLVSDYNIKHSGEELVNMYTHMTTLNVMDTILYDAQRQGRISFYMTSNGEEATHIGSASALRPEDVIFAQYREAGVLMWRGFSIENFTNQCFSNECDLGKGRQMPVHYGSRELNFQTISSPLGTQLPQAAGAAYAIKREDANKDVSEKRVVTCYFGEGAASEGDFHAAMNFATTLSCPVIFFVRNNGYAISTPSREQYKGDGIASRGNGYGMYHIRVDGNDLLAVHDVMTEARNICVTKNEPVLVEAMTYRGGHHSTSDDSTRYRKQEEIQYWMEVDNPLIRTRLLLERLQLWDSNKETELRKNVRRQVMDALSLAEKKKKPAISQLFNDVYDSLPSHLQQQQQELYEHLEKYGSKYGLEEFADESTYVDPARL